jgi:catechol 2,3-dioxygenase-like lactoylglutathione lyase family enzyme
MGIRIEGLAPLIQVFDMRTSLGFYREVLGFEVVRTSPPRDRDDFDWALLRLDGIELMLNTAYEVDKRPAEPDAARVAAHGDTALYFGCRDLDSAHKSLQSRGVTLRQPEVAHYGMKQLFLRDPDGYTICLQWLAD